MKFRHVAHHGLGVDTARSLLEQAFVHYSARYPQVEVERTWLGEGEAHVVLRGRGLRVLVLVRCDEQRVTAETDLPLLLRPFAGRIRERLDRELQKWLQTAPTTA